MTKVNKGKDMRKKLELHKKYYTKDSIRAAKKAWKSYKQDYKDSLKSVGNWKDAKHHRREILLGKWNNQKSDIVGKDARLDLPKDSIDWALNELILREDYHELQKIYESYGQYDSIYIEKLSLDSIQIDTSKWIKNVDIKEYIAKYLPSQLKYESDLKIDNQLKYGKLDEFGNLQKIDRSGVIDFFKNVKVSEFNRSRLSLKSTQDLYKKVPSLEKREEGIKKKSLKGEPLKTRLFLNGNIAIQSTDPFVFDSNIQLGYKWNSKFSSGTGLMYREQLFQRDTSLELLHLIGQKEKLVKAKFTIQ